VTLLIFQRKCLEVKNRYENPGLPLGHFMDAYTLEIFGFVLFFTKELYKKIEKLEVKLHKEKKCMPL